MTISQGKLGNILGKIREEKVVSLLSDPETKFSWIKSVRRSSKEEDSKGIDVVIETKDAGILYLQVKSSRKHAQRFRKQYKEKKEMRGIGIVIANDDKSEETLHQQIRCTIKRMRSDVLNNKKIKKFYSHT